MKCDLLYKSVFSPQNSLESIAILNTYYRADTAKLWEWMCMWLSILFPICQWNIQHLNLMLSTVRTLPAELNTHCECSLASNSNRVHCVLQGKKSIVLTSKNFPSALFFINFSFLLLFAFQIDYTFAYFILRSQPFLIDLFIMFGFGRWDTAHHPGSAGNFSTFRHRYIFLKNYQIWPFWKKKVGIYNLAE